MLSDITLNNYLIGTELNNLIRGGLYIGSSSGLYNGGTFFARILNKGVINNIFLTFLLF